MRGSALMRNLMLTEDNVQSENDSLESISDVRCWCVVVIGKFPPVYASESASNTWFNNVWLRALRGRVYTRLIAGLGGLSDPSIIGPITIAWHHGVVCPLKHWKYKFRNQQYCHYYWCKTSQRQIYASLIQFGTISVKIKTFNIIAQYFCS